MQKLYDANMRLQGYYLRGEAGARTAVYDADMRPLGRKHAPCGAGRPAGGLFARRGVSRYEVLTISFELTKEIVERKGETCRALPRKIARHTGGGFSPLRLVASRRHGRRRALFAALPVAPAAPLSQKSRFAAIFGSPVCFRGTPFFMRAAFTSIRILIREKRQKCDFAVFSYCFQRSFGARGFAALTQDDREGGHSLTSCLLPRGKVACGQRPHDGRGAFAPTPVTLSSSSLAKPSQSKRDPP